MSNLLSKERPRFSERLARYADALAIGVAIALPWSASATSIFILLWLIALVPTLTFAELRREITNPAGGLPVLLFSLGLLGMAWSDASWPERFGGFDSFIKFPLVPFLFVQFRRSDRGVCVMIGYLVSCTVLLAVLTISAFLSGEVFAADSKFNAMAARAQFDVCGLALLFVSIDMFRRDRTFLAAIALIIAFGFLAGSFFFVTTNVVLVRYILLVVIPALILLLIFKKFGWKTTIGFLVAGTALCVVVWSTSQSLQRSTAAVWQGIRSGDVQMLIGERRPVFWQRSLRFIGEAPFLGHGTGATAQLFSRAAAGQTGVLGQITTNPHQQTFAVGIQLGLVGIAALWAMWIAQLLFFVRGDSLPHWIGFLVVIQNIIGSMFDSYLFDFSQGWTYVFGVGVAGGMVLRGRQEQLR